MMYPAYDYREVMQNRWHNPPAREWYWRNVRLPVLRRDGWKCRRCGRRRSESVRLVVHHTAYKDPKTGVSIVGHEEKYLHLLESVCERCHAAIHHKRWYHRLFGL